MEDGSILNDQISVSHNPDSKGASRLAGPNDVDTLVWIADRNRAWWPDSTNQYKWIQVDFAVQRLITGVIIQGRKRSIPNDGRLQYVTVFTVQFGNDGISFENLAFLGDDLVRYSLSN